MAYQGIFNKQLMVLALALLPLASWAQIKVGDNPAVIESSAELEVESTSKGFLPPRMTEAQMNAISSPAEGLMVFCMDCSSKGVHIFDGTDWLSASGPASEVGSNGSAIIASYGGAGCTGSGSINGTMDVGVAVSGVTMTLYANVTQAGTWSLTAVQNGVTFSGSGIFAATGCQQITLTGSGTPVSSGTFTWTTNSAPAGYALATVNPDNSSGGSAVVASYGGAGCSGGSGSISGTMTEGIAVSGVTMELYADVTQAGTWSLEATENGVTFSGSGTFAATGCQLITLTGSGTPAASGSFTWTTNSTPAGSAEANINVIGIPGDGTCDNKISIVPCSMVQGATINDDPSTIDGIEYDWINATSTTLGVGFGAPSNTRALVEIGGQCWARFNMGIATGGVCYNDDANICAIEGRLYSFWGAMNDSHPTKERGQGVCPIGWHVPNDCEWIYLENTLGMSIADQTAEGERTSGSVGEKLRAGGNNSSGFSALAAGQKAWWGPFQGRGTTTAFWMSNINPPTTNTARARFLGTGVTRTIVNTNAGHSIRCIKD